MKFYLVTMFSFLSLTMVGCEGTEGPTGPKGKDGNANVRGTVYDVQSSDWSNIGGGVYTVTLLNNYITQDIMDKGMVFVYKYTSTGWENLPYMFTENGYDAQLYARHQLSQVKLYKEAGYGYQPAGSSFKVVVVASLAKVQSRINWNNYNEVKQAFDIQE